MNEKEALLPIKRNFATNAPSKVGGSNSNWSEGQMRTYEVIRGPHYDADATMVVPEPY